ncbi:MAG: glycosyltransferase family 4 protein [Chthoniobacterales bacterium]
MRRVAYLFERFPSFGQTFCYREVAELLRQGCDLTVFSIRRPTSEPPADWAMEIVERISYLPEEAALLAEVTQLTRQGKLPQEAVRAMEEWGRRTDFLRLAQAAVIGPRLRELGIERVHAHFAGMAARTAYWIREFFGIDYSLTAHANDIFAPRDFAVSLPMIMERAVAIVTESDFAADYVRSHFPAEAARVHRVYNGLDLSRFQPATFDADPPRIISVGRLIEKKGFRTLIAACARLRRMGRAFHCEIIGDGPLHEELSAQIQAHGLRENVVLAGPLAQADVAARMAAATLFVLPCTRELDGGMDNLPTVIMEAMASGLPVISTPIAGVPEMVEADVTGALVPPDDPIALADAITALLTEPARARRFGARGRERAAEKFSIEPNVMALREILQRL